MRRLLSNVGDPSKQPGHLVCCFRKSAVEKNTMKPLWR